MNKEENKSNFVESKVYDFESGSDSWRELGVQRSSFIHNDIEA